MKVSFVIPSYNNFHLVNQLLVDINEHTSPDEVIVVDDASTDITAIDGLQWWVRNVAGIRGGRNPENLGFLKTSNIGLKMATGDVVCLISTDVRIHQDLRSVAEGMMTVSKKLLLGGRYLDWDTGWNTFDGKTFPYIEGWLLITTKDNWEDLGYLDERFAPHDFEDVDLSTTAISKGLDIAQVVAVKGLLVEHVGAQSIKYGEEREKITKENREKFRQKWMS